MTKEERIQYLANIYHLLLADNNVAKVEEKLFERIAKEVDASYLERRDAMALVEGDDFRVAYAPRPDFLQEIGNAKVTVFVPNPTEGFYLPALEGMALGTAVVCPDCVGNRAFCLPGRNCFRPGFRIDEIVQAALAALDLGEAERRLLLDSAFRTATEHDLSKERRAFYHVLRNLDTLWQS